LYHELIDTDVGKRHHFKVDCQIQESDGSALFEGIDIAFVLKDAKGDAFESIYTKGLRLLPQQITPCELDNADRLTDPPDVAHVAVEASVNRLYSFPASNLKKK
jgi:hypothetical protein